MRQALSSRRYLRPLYLSLILLMGLWGCAGAPDKREPTTPESAEPAGPPPQRTTDLSLPPSSHSARFELAEQALARFDWMSASVALQPLLEQPLNLDDSSYLSYLQARIDYSRGEQEQALETASRLEYPGIHPALQYRARSFRRHALQLERRYLESAALGERQLQDAPPQQQPALRREIWLDLQRADEPALQQALVDTTDMRWHGWLELALIARASGPGAVTDLSTWMENNSDHPAATEPPGGLEYLPAGSGTPSGKVAVILPLSGRLAAAGKAVLEGYLASYYAARSAGGAALDLQVLDQDRYDSAGAAYRDAQAQGASMVVGPLSKDSVAELATLPDRPLPILALNRMEVVLPATGHALVQMSLSPEDEAARIAELAFGQGARSGLILRPQGEWGTKVEQALRRRWAALGGQVVGSESYSGRDEYSSAVKSGLMIGQSEQRARGVRDMLATNIEFTARRRKDLDVIFLLSRNGPEARAIKPLLAFHYAGTVPVFAMSSIYSGIPDSRDKDLDGIYLVETPWLLGASPGLRVAIAAGGTGSDNYTRLNALGADAFLLQSRFAQLRSGPDLVLRGNTGLLTLDPGLRLQRELPLATFDGDTLRAR